MRNDRATLTPLFISPWASWGLEVSAAEGESRLKPDSFSLYKVFFVCVCDHECHYADLQKKGGNDIRAQAQESGRFLSYSDTEALSRLLDKQNL